jgi:dynein heavy chain
MDLMTREVFMPLLCADLSSNEQADKIMDIMHRIITQLAVAQSQVEDSVTLPLPALPVLASAASNPARRLTVLHILETTLINWQKQIKNVLKQQPEVSLVVPTFFTNDEIHIWTTCINKLNNLIVQLDAPHVKDILMNLENNNSVYTHSFGSIKNDIKIVNYFNSIFLKTNYYLLYLKFENIYKSRFMMPR